MIFNSAQFFVFYFIVASVYFVLPFRLQWFWLLIASFYFYMALVPAYLLILLLLIFIDYYAAIVIETSEGAAKKIFLVGSILATCAALFFMKYYNFYCVNVNHLAAFFGWNYSMEILEIVLPVGLSFHTFQSLGYVIDVYRGQQKAERHLGIYALFVMFFPQLVAGPIERAGRLIHQFREVHRFDYPRIADGCKLVLWGLFKKVVIADRIALIVDQVYGNVYAYHGLPLIVATVLFAFQIYCDFSGYSDMAIGIAKTLGIRLMDNFNRPYFSKSISEFWKRWHISLMSWFRDYLYIPLGGNRVGLVRWLCNIMVVFIISGLWHGASWNFVIWGALNGGYLVFAILSAGWRERFVRLSGLDRFPQGYKLIKVGTTFSLVCFSWIFFRSQNLSDAGYIVTNMFRGIGDPAMISGVLNGLGAGAGNMAVIVAAIGVMESAHVLQRRRNLRQALSRKPAWVRLSVYSLASACVLVFGNFTSMQFIYFQF